MLSWSSALAPVLRPASLALLSLAVSLAAAAPAAALSQVFFTGPNGFGTTQAEAQHAALAPNVSMRTITAVDFATNLTPTRNLDNGSIDPNARPVTATSMWSITNETGGDLIGELYLVFAKPLPNTTPRGNQVDYDPTTVGLDLQKHPGDTWVIFDVDFDPSPNNVYYPAVLLGSLADGQTTASPFAVNYILDDPSIFLDSQGFELGIPKWQVFRFFVPIPEPSTALLLGAGLAGLAFRRRRE